jgi:tRNA G18 (ribose-2'-O)-methylase SpoU
MCRSLIHQTGVYDASPAEGRLAPPEETSCLLIGFLDNIRSSMNVGSIFRSADGIGVSKLFLGGITPSPDNPGVQKTALGAERSVVWEKANNGVEKIGSLKVAGYQIWGLEYTPNADGLYSLGASIPPQPLVLVVGNEVCGIDPQIMSMCDRIVFIPMVGKKHSYNVATAFGIAASYLRYRQILSHGSVSKLPKTSSTP